MTRLERITEFRRKIGYKTAKEFADFLQISPSQISEIDKKDKPANLLHALETKTNINLNWLETGLGDMFKNKLLSLPNNIKNITGEKTDVYYLAGAGDPRVSSGEVVISITLPLDFTKTGIIPVIVKGESMNPIILDGAIVGVDTSDKHVMSGKMYAVWIEDEGALIKTLLIGYESVTVKSENPLFHSFEVPKAALQDHFILGRVKWWINQEKE